MRSMKLELGLLAALVAIGAALLIAGPGGRTPAGVGVSTLTPCEGAPVVEGAADIGRDGDVLAIAGVVEELRGLRFEALPEPTYLPDPDFSAAVTEQPLFREGEAEALGRMLQTLGAVPADYDLEAEIRRIVGDAVVGYYEPETEELVVRGAGPADGYSPLERVTLVHELQHALADESLGLRPLDDPATDADELYAYQALVEGDAQLVTDLYAAQGLTAGDQLRLGFSGLGGLGTEIPYFIERSASFPYLEGSRFACHLFQRGGWEAVDAAYAAPPRTTAEILFPERYPADPPADLEDPEGPGDGWERLTSMTFGAADLLFLLEAPGGEPSAAVPHPLRTARGLTAGEVHVWARGDRSAVGLSLVGDPALCDAVAAWLESSRPDGLPGSRRPGDAFSVYNVDLGAGLVRCDGGEVRVGLGPDLAIARATAT